jgi:hypothetical protein
MTQAIDQSVVKEWESLRSRGITGTRELPSMAPSSLRESDRSFLCVASTETPAVMVDWEAGRYIDEILIASGGSIPNDHVPLLRNHRRFDPSDDIYGSAREWKLEDQLQWVCRCFISEASDPQDPVNRAWTRVKGGHLRGVSVGYQVLAYTDIPAGEKKKVGDRYFTAKPERRLRVSTEWVVHELSLTPIGADKKALTRSKGMAPPVVTGFRAALPPIQGSYFR